jgi:hypothetical protein
MKRPLGCADQTDGGANQFPTFNRKPNRKSGGKGMGMTTNVSSLQQWNENEARLRLISERIP